MKVVLYTHDLEPITVINLTGWMQEYVQTRSWFSVQVIPPIDYRKYSHDTEESVELRKVDIEVVPLYMSGGRKSFMLLTRDEEDAMLLESAFLPGQRKAVLDERSMAYSEGFMRALMG